MYGGVKRNQCINQFFDAKIERKQGVTHNRQILAKDLTKLDEVPKNYPVIRQIIKKGGETKNDLNKLKDKIFITC